MAKVAELSHSARTTPDRADQLAFWAALEGECPQAIEALKQVPLRGGISGWAQCYGFISPAGKVPLWLWKGANMYRGGQRAFIGIENAPLDFEGIHLTPSCHLNGVPLFGFYSGTYHPTRRKDGDRPDYDPKKETKEHALKRIIDNLRIQVRAELDRIDTGRRIKGEHVLWFILHGACNERTQTIRERFEKATSQAIVKGVNDAARRLGLKPPRHAPGRPPKK